MNDQDKVLLPGVEPEQRWTPATMEAMLTEIERRLDTNMHLVTTDQFVAGVRHLSSIINAVFHDPITECGSPAPLRSVQELIDLDNQRRDPVSYAASRELGKDELERANRVLGADQFPEPLGYRG